MKTRIPLEYHGKPIRLHYADDPIPRKYKGKHGSLYHAIWEIMEKYRDTEPGTWWTLTQTQRYTPAALQKLNKALRQRIYRNGYTNEHISMIITLVDGVCFRWSASIADMNTEYIGDIKTRRLRLRHRHGVRKESEIYEDIEA